MYFILFFATFLILIKKNLKQMASLFHSKTNKHTVAQPNEPESFLQFLHFEFLL